MIKKVRQHINQTEPLLFENSSPGKRGYQLPALDVPAVDAAAVLGAQNTRTEIEDFPEVSEVEAIRHFTRLSTHNYAIDLGLDPRGSCTMKYNPRVNEQVARIEGLAWAHPYHPEALSQGILEVMGELEKMLLEITGMDAVTLQPAAGANVELTCIRLIRALLESRGNPRKKVLIPDSAHGTNPATATMVGYSVENIKSNDRGMVDVESLARAVDEDVAALMITNPNTLGVFEENITRIAQIMHAKGAMVYMDGANMNALVGIARPGVHYGAWGRWSTQRHYGRGAQRQLHPRANRRSLRSTAQGADHARMRLQRRAAGQARRAHRRHRQAPDRLWIPPIHRQLPADCARRDDDRADRDREQGGAGSFC